MEGFELTMIKKKKNLVKIENESSPKFLVLILRTKSQKESPPTLINQSRKNLKKSQQNHIQIPPPRPIKEITLSN